MIKKMMATAAVCMALGMCAGQAAEARGERAPAPKTGVTVVRIEKHGHDAARAEKYAGKSNGGVRGKRESRATDPVVVITSASEKESIPEKETPSKPQFEDKRIEINLASRLLTLYQGDVGIRMYSIAPGKPSTPTPVGRRKVVEMEVNPTWVDPEHPEVSIPAGPDCPIGYRWIGLGGNYGIHGTNAPWAIGSYASHGCVRMKEEDVEDLYAHIVKGIPVDIIYERVVAETAPDHTVIYYIYPDGYGQQPLKTEDVKRKLSLLGASSFAWDEEIEKAIDASDGTPHYVVKVYDLYVKGKKLEAKAFGKDGHIYLPVMPLSAASGVKASWSPNWGILKTDYGEGKAVLRNRALLMDAADAPALFHLTGSLDETYCYELK